MGSNSLNKGSLRASGQFGVQYPKILGHEGSGYVRRIGKNVTSVEVGDPVILSFYSCGDCEQCCEKHPAYCHSFARENYVGRRGHVTAASASASTSTSSAAPSSAEIYSRFFGQSSFARFSIVDKSSVVNAKTLVRDEDELRLFAPLGCGFQTGMGAIENIAQPEEGSVVVVLGLGSVGLAALMTAILRKFKAVVGVDRVASRLRLAAELGATHLIDTAPDGVNVHREICGLFPTGVSLVIDTTGSPQRIEEGLKSLRQRGKLVLAVSAIEHMNTGRVVMGCIEGDCVPKEAIAKLIQWYREGRFPFDKLITYFEAHEFKQALDRLDEGTVIKAVLKWNNTL